MSFLNESVNTGVLHLLRFIFSTSWLIISKERDKSRGKFKNFTLIQKGLGCILLMHSIVYENVKRKGRVF